jgi:prepilin signal peptidase PulO-like enzyme (type II secretory pathway)
MTFTVIYFFLFLFGVIFGSFFNVVTLRYIAGESVFKNIGGRSHCMHCGKQLAWFELVPLFSFLFQLGKCRGCKARLTLQYPIVEFLTGSIFAGVGYFFISHFGAYAIPYAEIAIWIIAFCILLLMSIIDLRLQIIPDSLTVAIVVLGIIRIGVYFFQPFGEAYTRMAVTGTFLGSFGTMLWPLEAAWGNALIGMVACGLFFSLLFVVTRGAGIGFGDVKLAFAGGLLMSWPDAFLAFLLAFIIGSICSLPLLILHKKGVRDAVPFGPFMAIGMAIVFFFGYDIVNAYFQLFKIV